MSVALHPSSLITRFFTSKPFSFFFVPETKIISFLFESFFSQQCSTIWKLLLFRYIFFYLLLLLIFLYFASAPLDALRDRFITLFSHADTTKQKTKKRLSSASSSLSLSFHLLFWVPCFFPLYRWRWLFISSVQWNTFAERERERAKGKHWRVAFVLKSDAVFVLLRLERSDMTGFWWKRISSKGSASQANILHCATSGSGYCSPVQTTTTYTHIYIYTTLSD